MTKDIRFAEKSIGAVLNHPVLIVGQNPGRQRAGEKTHIVWEGNRSADFLMWCLQDETNIYLTNICNYQEMTPERIEEGKTDLRVLIEQLEPKRIICLGGYSYDVVSRMYRDLLLWPVGIMNIHGLNHPSWIVRFNRDREEYKKELVDLIRKK